MVFLVPFLVLTACGDNGDQASDDTAAVSDDEFCVALRELDRYTGGGPEALEAAGSVAPDDARPVFEAMAAAVTPPPTTPAGMVIVGESESWEREELMVAREAALDAATECGVEVGILEAGVDEGLLALVVAGGPASEDVNRSDDDIIEYLAGQAEFTTLLAVIEEAGLVETLQGENLFTLFAPTDAAFDAALTDLGLSLDELLGDTELLTSIVENHLIEAEVPMPTSVEFTETHQTLGGEEVLVGPVEETVDVVMTTPTGNVVRVREVDKVGDAEVIFSDVFVANGVIHGIDAVLLPQ